MSDETKRLIEAMVRQMEDRGELLAACRALAGEIHLSKLNIRKDFSLINAHACALKAISRAEGRS